METMNNRNYSRVVVNENKKLAIIPVITFSLKIKSYIQSSLKSVATLSLSRRMSDPTCSRHVEG